MNEPALVLLHGYPFDHTIWDHVAAFLDPAFTVLAPDLRGFGQASLDNSEPSLDWMADDIATLLAEKEITRAVVAGMSMGGYVALAFAEKYKDRLAALALIDSQAIADSEETRTQRRALAERVRREGPTVAAEALMPRLFSPSNRERPELRRFALHGAEQAGVEGISWALEAMARRPDRTPILQALKVPLLVVHGAEDAIVPVERARALAESLPGCEFVEVGGAGHGTPMENPRAVADALMALLGRTKGL